MYTLRRRRTSRRTAVFLCWEGTKAHINSSEALADIRRDFKGALTDGGAIVDTEDYIIDFFFKPFRPEDNGPEANK